MSKEKKIKHEKKRKKRHIVRNIFLVLFLIIIISAIAAAFLGYNFYKKHKIEISNCIKDGYKKVESIDENTFNGRHSTKIYDKDGNLLKEFKVNNSIYKSYNEINPLVFKASIAIEDERFYDHKGIDYKGILRAGVKYLTSKGQEVQGGSTITQQLCKYTFLTLDKTMWRKLEEMVIAQELEKKYTKNEILEFYVNNNYFGYGCYGIESASEYFFQKSTNDLTLSEIAFLVGIPNNPTVYDPINKIDNTLERRNLILNKMLELGYITKEEYDKAVKEEIVLNVNKVYFDNTVDDYALDLAVNESTKILMKMKGFQFKYIFSTEEERVNYFDKYNELYNSCRDEFLTGGYEVNTTIDMELQNQLQWYIDNELQGETEVDEETGIYKRQAAATVIDNSNGTVVAIVGGRTQEGNTYNRALLSARQPGSAIKPLIAYTPAFENGYYPDEMYMDEPIENGPSNWFDGYYGNISLRYAIETSVNTIPYRLMESLGVDKCKKYLTNMEFKYLTPEDNSPILAVGGWSKGATTIEMAGGFSTLARNGTFIEPTNVLKITKVGVDKEIYENAFLQKKIYDEGACYLTTDALKGVLTKEYATAHGSGIDNFVNQAGKTGSTDEYKDLWMAGYTPYYTAVVWNGTDTPEPLYSSMSASKNIWKNMMTYLHKDLEDKEFQKPESIYEENGQLKNNLSSGENKILLARKNEETTRKSSEINEQTERLKENSYRIEYGLSDKEEEAREKKAKIALEELSEYNLTKSTQEEELNKLLEKCSRKIEEVKKVSSYNEYILEYKNLKTYFTNKLNSIKAEEKRKLEEKNRVNKPSTSTAITTSTANKNNKTNTTTTTTTTTATTRKKNKNN